MVVGEGETGDGGGVDLEFTDGLLGEGIGGDTEGTGGDILSAHEEQLLLLTH